MDVSMSMDMDLEAMEIEAMEPMAYENVEPVKRLAMSYVWGREIAKAKEEWESKGVVERHELLKPPARMTAKAKEAEYKQQVEMLRDMGEKYMEERGEKYGQIQEDAIKEQLDTSFVVAGKMCSAGCGGFTMKTGACKKGCVQHLKWENLKCCEINFCKHWMWKDKVYYRDHKGRYVCLYHFLSDKKE